MFDLHLSIFHKVKNASLIEELQEASVPNRVSCDWKKIEQTSGFEIPSNCYSLLITDDEDLLLSIKTKMKYTCIAYLGPVYSETPFLEFVDQVWYGLDITVIGRLFSKLLVLMRSHFDAMITHSALQTIIDTVPDMVWVKRIDGIHLAVNEKFSNTVGRSKEDCYMKTHEYIWNVSKEEVEKGVICMDSEEEVIKNNQLMVFEETVQLKDSVKQLSTSKAPIHDDFGNIIATCGIGKDVTDFNNMGLEMSIFIENTPLPVLVCDEQYKVLRMNSNFKELSGLDPQELASFEYLNWKKDALTPVSEKEIGKNSVQQEFSYKLADMEVCFILIEQEIRNYFNDISGYYCLFMDVTLRRKYEHMLLTAATIDALTGLYNRRYFYDFIAEKKGHPMTILYIDLDRFKEVNDTFGHARGDEVLKKTANYIKEIFTGDTVARLGGDEFAVLHLGRCNSTELREKSNFLNKKIRFLFQLV